MSVRQRLRALAYRHLGGTALVLIYHRVADLTRDPEMLAVSPANFDGQMKMLSERFHVVPLSGLVRVLRSRSVPRRAVAVTFDDGYADNLTATAPVLARHRVPATVFVSSGYVDGGREFWWDEVERLVLEPGTLPARIELAANDARFSAKLGETTAYSAADAEAFSGWNVTEPGGGERQRVYADLCEFVRPLGVEQRDAVLAQLRAAAGAETCVRDSHRPLSAAEVRELEASAFVDVGGHTTDHVLLSARHAEVQRAQIEQDRSRLREMLGHSPEMFSYPYGGLAAYTPDSSRMVAQAGYVGACANHTGAVKPWTDPYRMPRIAIGDVDAETLAAQLEGWFDDPR